MCARQRSPSLQPSSGKGSREARAIRTVNSTLTLKSCGNETGPQVRNAEWRLLNRVRTRAVQTKG
eukprot:6117599-Alexandrium_andersonii.AAC.1